MQEYHKRGRIGDMLRICRAEGRSDPLLWVLACQTTAGAIPPEAMGGTGEEGDPDRCKNRSLEMMGTPVDAKKAQTFHAHDLTLTLWVHVIMELM